MTIAATLARRLVAEAGGTAFLAAAIAGSTTIAGRLAPTHAAMALVVSAVAVGCALAAVMLSLGRISGGYFNPGSTLRAAWARDLTWRDAALYTAAQTLGALVGVATIGFVMGDPVSMAGPVALTNLQVRRIEFVAAFGFVALDAGCRRLHGHAVPYALAAYLVALMCALGTMSAGNPAISIASAAIDPPAHVALAALISSLGGQWGGALVSALVMTWLLPKEAGHAAVGVIAVKTARRGHEEPARPAHLVSIE